MKTFVLLLITFIVFSSCKNNQINNEFHPMVDGRDNDWAELDKETIKISEEVNLYLFQNKYYVWLAYDYPLGSFGTLDMKIKTEKISNPINLHVSAQLGEWEVGDENNIPNSPNSELWWNNESWTANNLWVNGIDTLSYDMPEFKIKNGDIREVQLSKSRFGKGQWSIKLNINAIKTLDGKYVNLVFPETENYHSILIN